MHEQSNALEMLKADMFGALMDVRRDLEKTSRELAVTKDELAVTKNELVVVKDAFEQLKFTCGNMAHNLRLDSECIKKDLAEAKGLIDAQGDELLNFGQFLKMISVRLDDMVPPLEDVALLEDVASSEPSAQASSPPEPSAQASSSPKPLRQTSRSATRSPSPKDSPLLDASSTALPQASCSSLTKGRKTGRGGSQ